MIKHITDAVSSIAGGVHPLPLALILINVAFLLIVGFVLWEMSAHATVRDSMILELAKACRDGTT